MEAHLLRRYGIEFRPLAARAVVSLLGLLSLAASTRTSLAAVDPWTFVAQPAAALVMPFDATPGHDSQLVVSNVNGISKETGVAGITTHWTYYGSSGDHLVDVFVCLTLHDTVVVRPRSIQAIGPSNETFGPLADLEGHRGFVVVTAYQTDELCESPESESSALLVNSAITGRFTLSDGAEASSFGSHGIGFGTNPEGTRIELPNLTFQGPDQRGAVRLQTLAPSGLDSSRVILIALKESAGAVWSREIGPFRRRVRAFSTFYDTLSIATSLPDVVFNTMRFTTFTPALIPEFVVIESPGFLRLTDVVYGRNRRSVGCDSFVYAWVAESSGTFHLGSLADYTGIPACE